ncbi:phage tail protein [Chitinophaga sancti]|uniref:Microcystin-dependent protein n=1 Tax=Chitinophaga sancti TaxID=1004 RepID=A0A1K1M7Q4_9BACT|nr:tail fiber protein [Chitinophaga sancti]WQD64574.1 tail fiber protein [Chitinophaga sancti]WQG89802.1 tail fiber protein [Chitinophaga sancti]SFW19168.1 Microcystin-dependent protein [Chitinophaga sancti]
MENFIGEIRAFSYGRAPKGWIPCNGQLLPLAQNQALFALIGVYYGGNGMNNFQLPNLNGRTILGTGVSASGTNYSIGQPGGSETVTLTPNTLPQHNHLLRVSSAYDLGTPSTNFLGNPDIKGTSPVSNKANVNLYSPLVSSAMTVMGPCITSTGNNMPHENRQPFLVINYCIATQGVFPSRQ